MTNICRWAYASSELTCFSTAKRYAALYGVKGPLLTGNSKLDKRTQRSQGYRIKGLSLAPGNLSGHEMCPMRTADCTKACIGTTSGHNRYPQQKMAKINKTKFLVDDPICFFAMLRKELSNLVKYCDKHHLVPAVRLNTYSDVCWEMFARELFEEYSEIQFYDYTKISHRGPLAAAYQPESRTGSVWPENYSLTLSYTGYNWFECVRWLEGGLNVAVVMKDIWDQPLPETWRGYEVVSGDEDDCRWLDYGDGVGKIVALKIKGGIKDAGPFLADRVELTVSGDTPVGATQ